MAKKEDYYHALLDLARLFQDASQCVLRAFHDGKQIERSLQEIVAYQKQTNEVVERVTQWLMTDFLPPIDREDILALILGWKKAMDESVQLGSLLEMVRLLSVRELRSTAESMHHQSCAMVFVMEHIMPGKNRSGLQIHLEEWQKLQQKTMACFDKSMHLMYHTYRLPMDLIKELRVLDQMKCVHEACVQLFGAVLIIAIK